MKSHFQLNGPWEKVRLHNVTGKDLVYTRGNGDSFDFGDSKLCGLSNAQCLSPKHLKGRKRGFYKPKQQKRGVAAAAASRVVSAETPSPTRCP